MNFHFRVNCSFNLEPILEHCTGTGRLPKFYSSCYSFHNNIFFLLSYRCRVMNIVDRYIDTEHMGMPCLAKGLERQISVECWCVQKALSPQPLMKHGGNHLIWDQNPRLHKTYTEYWGLSLDWTCWVWMGGFGEVVFTGVGYEKRD